MRRKGFTLVELIVVIAIIAVLSVISVLIVSEWIGKSRDTRRLGDLNQIEKALEISMMKNNSYPMPDSNINVTASGTLIGYQGKFCDGSVSNTSIKTTPKDPLDNICYTYYTTTGMNQYQLMAMMESNKKIVGYERNKLLVESQKLKDNLTLLYNYSLIPLFNDVYGADYSKRYPSIKGEKLGILLSSSTNQPIEDTGMGVDIVNTTNNYIAYFGNDDKISGTGQFLQSLKLGSTLGYGLISYFNFENIVGTGLNDLSGKGNFGVISGAVQTGGKVGTGLYFNGNAIVLFDQAPLNNLSDFTWAGWINLNSFTGVFYSEGRPDQTMAINFNSVDYSFPRIRMRMRNANRTPNWYGTPESFSYQQQLNQWYFVVFTVNGASTDNADSSVYINGEKLTQGKAQKEYNSGTRYSALGGNIGAFKGGVQGTAYMIGTLDEIRIYNRALSEKEVSLLYNSTK